MKPPAGWVYRAERQARRRRAFLEQLLSERPSVGPRASPSPVNSSHGKQRKTVARDLSAIRSELTLVWPSVKDAPCPSCCYSRLCRAALFSYADRKSAAFIIDCETTVVAVYRSPDDRTGRRINPPVLRDRTHVPS